jgi:GntR family transcriptional regulator/MocR family aminotransferase
MMTIRQTVESDHESESTLRSRNAAPSFPLAISAIALNAESPVPIYEQICKAIRIAINIGDMPAGTPLPTSRELATVLAIGRNTVVTAYSRLVAEGYLVSNTRRGTRVSEHPLGAAIFEPGTNGEARAGDNRQISSGTIEISHRARRILEEPFGQLLVPRPFALNTPDASLYPRNHLSRLLTEEFCRSPSRDAQHGQQRFQAALAAYLRHMRGVHCEPVQVIPISGIEAALDLTARVMIDPGHSVLVEDPAPGLVRQAFQAAGARLDVLPTDGQGADPDRTSGPPPRLIYVSPSVGFPLGCQMSEMRRLAVLDLAQRTGAVIFEADAYWELSYTGSRPRAVHGYDRDGQVLYFGSLNETLGPHIRVGYIVVPPALVRPFADMAQRVGYGPDAFVLAALATFIENNHYAMHIKAIRSAYSQRLRIACEALRIHLSGCTVVEPSGGFHVTILFPRGIDEGAACNAALAHGLTVFPLSSFFLHPHQIAGLVLGLGTVPNRNVETMIRRLAEVIENVRRSDRPLELAS